MAWGALGAVQGVARVLVGGVLSEASRCNARRGMGTILQICFTALGSASILMLGAPVLLPQPPASRTPFQMRP